MRQLTSSVMMLLVLALALTTSACGGFDNTPFRTGTVRGHLTEADPSVALVSLVGDPDARSTVAADGTFVLEQVPAGPVELFIVASANKAVRLPIMVPGGGSARLQGVVPRAAGFLELRVRGPARQPLVDGQVSVTGTPFRRLPLPEDGSLRVGPLPEGCYTLEASAAGLPVKKTEACVKESESREVKIQLPGTDGNLEFVDRGCALPGCERATPCTPEDPCAPGISCRDERCQPPAAP